MKYPKYVTRRELNLRTLYRYCNLQAAFTRMTKKRPATAQHREWCDLVRKIENEIYGWEDDYKEG